MPAHFGYTLVGAVLLSVAIYSRAFSWQTAITATYCAFALDFVKNRSDLPAPVLWVFLMGTTGAVAVCTARSAAMRPLFLLLAGSSVMVALGKGLLLPPRGISLHLAVTEMTFTALAVAAILLAPRFEPPA